MIDVRGYLPPHNLILLASVRIEIASETIGNGCADRAGLAILNDVPAILKCFI